MKWERHQLIELINNSSKGLIGCKDRRKRLILANVIMAAEGALYRLERKSKKLIK